MASVETGAYLVTVEGNSDDKVQMVSRAVMGGDILGYGETAENTAAKVIAQMDALPGLEEIMDALDAYAEVEDEYHKYSGRLNRC